MSAITGGMFPDPKPIGHGIVEGRNAKKPFYVHGFERRQQTRQSPPQLFVIGEDMMTGEILAIPRSECCIVLESGVQEVEH